MANARPEQTQDRSIHTSIRVSTRLCATDSETNAIDVNFDVTDSRAFNRFGCGLDGAVDENDGFDGQVFDPLDHGLRDLVVRLRHEHLQGVGALADVHEHHLGALCTRRVYAGADGDLLAVHVRRKLGNLLARSALARSRLDQRQLAVTILCIVVVQLGLGA